MSDTADEFSVIVAAPAATPALSVQVTGPPGAPHAVAVPGWSVSTACQVAPPSVDSWASIRSSLLPSRALRPPGGVRSTVSVTRESASGTAAGPTVCAPGWYVTSGMVKLTGTASAPLLLVLAV